MMEKTDIVFKEYKSSFFDDAIINDYLSVLNDAFNVKQDKSFFVNKYLNNVYGPSIWVIAYFKEEPVGADALWRNDIDGGVAYQSADTCVKNKYQGLGIFKELVRRKLLLVEPGAKVYGFPNVNSTHGFLRMGWNLINEYRPRLYNGYNNFRKEHPFIIDSKYAQYWFTDKKKYFVIKSNGHFLLLSKRSSMAIYSIVGEIDEDGINIFDMVKKPCLMLYKSSNPTWYNKNRIPTRIITWNDKFDVPVWKMDSI